MIHIQRDVKQALFNHQNLSTSLVEGLESGGDRPPSTIFARPVMDVLQLSKSGRGAIGRVDRATSHAATPNSLLMN